MNKIYLHHNSVEFNKWYSVDDYHFPFWCPDSFEFPQLVVCNKEAIYDEGARLHQTKQVNTYTDDTGKVYKITPTIKLVYLYLKTRFDYFTKECKEYYDTNKDIGVATGIDEQAVIRAVKELIKMGLVKKTTIKFRNLPKNVYTDVKDLRYVVSVSAEDATQSSKHSQVTSTDLEFDDDFPF